jgi:hypothetical protein
MEHSGFFGVESIRECLEADCSKDGVILRFFAELEGWGVWGETARPRTLDVDILIVVIDEGEVAGA